MCKSAADCPNGNQCIFGFCLPLPGGGGGKCTTDKDCAAFQHCMNNMCVFGPPTMCKADSDCGANQRCMNGLCVP